MAESWEVCAEGLGEGPEVCGGVHGEAMVLVARLAWGGRLVGRGWYRGRGLRLRGWEAEAGVVAPCVGVDGALHALP